MQGKPYFINPHLGGVAVILILFFYGKRSKYVVRRWLNEFTPG